MLCFLQASFHPYFIYILSIFAISSLCNFLAIYLVNARYISLVDVAERVFYRCVVSNTLPVEHPDYEVTCNYEFLEDTIMDWGHELGRVRPNHFESRVQKKGWNRGIMTRVPVADYAKKQFQLKDNHPLMIMVNID